MKILFLHSYSVLGDWNMRLKRQLEIMSQIKGIKVKEFSLWERETPDALNKIREEEADLIYAVGFQAGYIANQSTTPYIYDMGSFRCRTILFEKRKWSLAQMIGANTDEMRSIINERNSVEYLAEEKAILNAKKIISWDSGEILLAKKLFGTDIRVIPFDPFFRKLPAKKIAFKDKKKEVLISAAKWSSDEKNFGMIKLVKKILSDKNIKFSVIGKEGGDVSFVEHSALMKKLNQVRVLFCPFYFGGINTIMEAIALGVNVVMLFQHPFRKYAQADLFCADRPGDAIEKIEKALDVQYPHLEKLPTEAVKVKELTKILKDAAGIQ